MGLLDAIFHPDRNRQEQEALHRAGTVFKTLTTYTPAFTTWGGAIYESDLVRAAIDTRARHISKLKVEILGSARPSLQAKMKHGPNSWQTWPQFLYRASTITDATTNCVICPVLDEDMQTTGYFPILPSKCEVVESGGRLWLRYRFHNGQMAASPMEDCAILTRFQYKNDFFGDGNGALDDTMRLIHLQDESIKEAIKSTARYSFIAQIDNFAFAEDLAEERKRFTRENLTAEAEAENGLLLFPNTYKNIKQITTQPYTVDAEQTKVIQENVYNYFGVSVEALQNRLVGDSWSAYYEGAIEPWAIQFSEAMSKAMFTLRERSNGAMVMATANRLQYMSNADKLQVSAQMADRGIMTRNEIREIWNLPPIEGGDVPTIRGEYYLINDEGNIVKGDEEGASNADEGQ